MLAGVCVGWCWYVCWSHLCVYGACACPCLRMYVFHLVLCLDDLTVSELANLSIFFL